MKKNKKVNFKIKIATKEDLAKFLRIFKIALKKDFKEYSLVEKKFFLKEYFVKENLTKWLKDSMIILLLLANEKEVGFLIGNKNLWGGVASFSWVWVEKKFRNKGGGSFLLKSYENIMKKKGAHQIMVLVTNPKNFQFYHKNKYRLGGYIPRCFFKLDHWWWYKNV